MWTDYQSCTQACTVLYLRLKCIMTYEHTTILCYIEKIKTLLIVHDLWQGRLFYRQWESEICSISSLLAKMLIHTVYCGFCYLVVCSCNCSQAAQWKRQKPFAKFCSFKLHKKLCTSINICTLTFQNVNFYCVQNTFFHDFNKPEITHSSSSSSNCISPQIWGSYCKD